METWTHGLTCMAFTLLLHYWAEHDLVLLHQHGSVVLTFAALTYLKDLDQSLSPMERVHLPSIGAPALQHTN